MVDHSIFEQQYDGTTYEPIDHRFILEGSAEKGPVLLRREPEIGVLVSLEHRWPVHSPTGFEWGYAGSGPADLALNILGEFVPPPEAWRLHQHYKFDVIAKLSRGSHHVIPATDVIDWIRNFWARERARGTK